MIDKRSIDTILIYLANYIQVKNIIIVNKYNLIDNTNEFLKIFKRNENGYTIKIILNKTNIELRFNDLTEYETKQYIAFPNLNNSRYIFSFPKKNFLKGLNFYIPTNFIHLLKSNLIKMLVKTNLFKPNITISFPKTDTILKNLLESNFYTGVFDSKRTITVMNLKDDFYFTKIATDISSNEKIKNEFETMHYINNILQSNNIEHAIYKNFVTSKRNFSFDIYPKKLHFRYKPTKDLNKLYEYLNILQSDIIYPEIDCSKFKNLNNNFLKTYISKTINKKIPHSKSHGDFSPWNFYINNNKLYVFDYELFSECRPIFYDLIKYSEFYEKIDSKKFIKFFELNVNKYIQYKKLHFSQTYTKEIIIYSLVYFISENINYQNNKLFIKNLIDYIRNNKLTFVHLLNDFSGSPKVLSQIVKKYSKEDIELYTSKDEGFLSNLTSNHKHFFYKRFNNKFLTLLSYVLSQVHLFLKILKYKKEDTIYINTLLPFGAALGAKIKGCEVIYHIHETSIKPNILKKFLRYVVSKTASKVIFVSNDLASKESFENISSFTVHNALENSFLEKTKSYEYRFKYDDKFVVMMICSLKDYKGIPEFLQVAKKLVSNKDIHFRLILNAEQNEIDEYFGKESFPNITIHSKQKELEKYYSTSSLVLNLSRIDQCVETFGLTIIEAMAYGVPVIVPPVGGPVEIVEEDKEGYLISSYKVDEVSKKILLLSQSENLCLELSNNARKKVSDFSEDVFFKKINKVVSE